MVFAGSARPNMALAAAETRLKPAAAGSYLLRRTRLVVRLPCLGEVAPHEHLGWGAWDAVE